MAAGFKAIHKSYRRRRLAKKNICNNFPLVGLHFSPNWALIANSQSSGALQCHYPLHLSLKLNISSFLGKENPFPVLYQVNEN